MKRTPEQIMATALYDQGAECVDCQRMISAKQTPWSERAYMVRTHYCDYAVCIACLHRRRPTPSS